MTDDDVTEQERRQDEAREKTLAERSPSEEVGDAEDRGTQETGADGPPNGAD